MDRGLATARIAAREFRSSATDSRTSRPHAISVSWAQEINRIANRIQKVLEDANIKLASVASDPLGASGRAMLEAMLAGEQNAAQLAELSKGLLRNKIPELQLAPEGRVTEHHRFLLQQLYDHLLFTESKRKQIEEEIERRMRPFQAEVVRLCKDLKFFRKLGQRVNQ